MQNQEKTGQPKLPQELPPGVPFVPRIYPVLEEGEHDLVTQGRENGAWMYDSHRKEGIISGTLELTQEGLFFTTEEIDKIKIPPRRVKLDIPEKWLSRAGVGGKPLDEAVALNSSYHLQGVIDLEKTKEAGWPIGQETLAKKIYFSRWDEVISAAPAHWFCRQPKTPKAWDKDKVITEATKSRIACAMSAVVEDLYGPSARSIWFRRGDFDDINKLRLDWEKTCPPGEDRKFHGNWEAAIQWVRKNKPYWRVLSQITKSETSPGELTKIRKPSTPSRNSFPGEEAEAVGMKSHPINQNIFTFGLPYERIQTLNILAEDPEIISGFDKVHRTLAMMKGYLEKRPGKPVPGKTPNPGKKRGSHEKEAIRKEIARLLHSTFDAKTAFKENLEGEKQPAYFWGPPEEQPALRPPMTKDAALKIFNQEINRIKDEIGFFLLKGGIVWDKATKEVEENLGLHEQVRAKTQSGKLAQTREKQTEVSAHWDHIFRDVLKVGQDVKRTLPDALLTEDYQFIQLNNGSKAILSPNSSPENLLELCGRASREANAQRVIYLEEQTLLGNPNLDITFPHLEDRTPANEKIVPSKKGEQVRQRAPSLLELEPLIEKVSKTWKIQVLENTKDLLKEGSRQLHCVGGYTSQSMEGSCTILSVRPRSPSTPNHTSTVEIRVDMEGRPLIGQNRSMKNRAVSPENARMVKTLVDNLKKNRGLKVQSKAKAKEDLHNPGGEQANLFLFLKENPAGGYQVLKAEIYSATDPEVSEKMKEAATLPIPKGQELLWVTIKKKPEASSNTYGYDTDMVIPANPLSPREIERREFRASVTEARILRKNPATNKNKFIVSELTGERFTKELLLTRVGPSEEKPQDINSFLKNQIDDFRGVPRSSKNAGKDNRNGKEIEF